MLLLGVDSSSQAATAAVIKDGEILCEYTQNQNKTQSVKMLPMIERMLSDVELHIGDIDVFACGVGPGSFTGVRIGVATVRGFAKTLEKGAIPVNALEVLSNNVPNEARVIALISARENECYCAVYEENKEVLAPCVKTVEEIVALSKEAPCLLVGDGAVFNRTFFEENIPSVRIAQGKCNLISAASLAEVAYQKAQKGEIGTAESLVPLYLRKSQAEREYEARERKENTKQ